MISQIIATWILVAGVNNAGVTIPMNSEEACVAAAKSIPWITHGYCVNTQTGKIIR